MGTDTLLSVLTTAASAAAVIVTLIAIWSESRHNNMSLRASMLRELINEFDYVLRDERYRLAKFLLERDFDERMPYAIGGPIMDYFDSLGLHLRKGVLDLEMTWDMFHYWVGHYWPFLEKEVDRQLQEFGGVRYYDNIVFLHTELTRFGRKHKSLPHNEDFYSPERLRAFLLREVAECSPRLNEDRDPSESIDPAAQT